VSRLTDVPLTTLVKLGSIAVHVEEFMSRNGHELDAVAIKSLLDDPELQKWLKAMSAAALLPLKRK
jgi:hypothetical protein